MAQRMLLIDATGLIFRAYYSIRSEMSAPDGTPVNAVYGLMRMMMKVFRDIPAAACGIVFDAGRKTFRNEIMPEYKAHRPEPPDDLRPQFGLSIDTARATQAPVFILEGFEADDIIATLTGQARRQNYSVSILTGDRDILQLLSPQCEVLMPAKRGEFTVFSEKAFTDKYEFPVERFVDFKALMGDPSDNIPGVRGIGEKGAAKLVGTYGKLEQIYGNLDLVKPASMQAKLRQAKEEVFMFRDLVTLRPDVPVTYDFTQRTLPDFGAPELNKLLSDLGFNRIRQDAKDMGDLMADLY
ncbi:hypothetical protein JW859_03835 [bacterium]|nr:hypothetical protein [bacterium]